MAYKKGNNKQIIIGAASLFTYEDGELTDANLPAANLITGNSYVSALSYGATDNDPISDYGFRNIGYTSNGLEIMFQPDFGEVKVDQILDVAKLYKQGMKVNLKTTFVESTLENLLVAIAGNENNLSTGAVGTKFAGEKVLDLQSGELGECPVERGIVAVGPGTGDCTAGTGTNDAVERIYVGYRALSIESVTVAAKRDAATMFEVSFRLLPNDSGTYGKIVDRSYTADSAPRS